MSVTVLTPNCFGSTIDPNLEPGKINVKVDGRTIVVTSNGLTIHIPISSDPNNALEMRADGLYVAKA